MAWFVWIAAYLERLNETVFHCVILNFNM